jgi:hemerythrin-like metal-binding protein
VTGIGRRLPAAQWSQICGCAKGTDVTQKPPLERIVWSDALAIGDPQIDWEHRQLIALFGRLCDPARRGDVEFRRTCLEELVAHVCTHFDHEEELMRRVGYPDLDHHRKAHLSLTDQFNRFMTLFADHPQEMTEDDLPAFVGAWLVDHIRGDDRALGDYLRDRARAQRIFPGGDVPPQG